ncbi:MAG TPA: ROK family protein [Candidatus Binataceae bacterium]
MEGNEARGKMEPRVKKAESVKKESSAGREQPAQRGALTMTVDIGGTGIKAEKLDANGKPVAERIRISTPRNATPKKVIAIIRKLAKQLEPFERVSAGFPGVVKKGVVLTAPNLGKGWQEFKLERALAKRLGRPVRLANDADVQGLGCVSGRGIELVITLGTGFGSVIFVDGHRIHLEIGHHLFRKGRTYEDELGRRALERKGQKKWNRHLREAIEEIQSTFNYDRLYIGGGDAKHIRIKLAGNVRVVSNEEGLLGGIRLWTEPGKPARIRGQSA